jgi:peroxiredoxin
MVASQKSGPSKEKDTKLLAVGITAPDWQLSDAEGKVHSLSDYRGKVVVWSLRGDDAPHAKIAREIQG